MARGNDRTSGNALRVESALGLSALPITFSCWYRPDATPIGSAHSLMVVVEAGDVDEEIELAWLSSGAATILYAGGGLPGTAETSNTVGNGIWRHMCGVFISSTSRKVVLDADFANEGTDTTNVIFPTNIDRTALLRRDDVSPINHTDGRIADAAIWSVELSDNEITALAAGWSPNRIRTAALAGYWPCFGVGAAGEVDLSGGGNNMSEVGTVTVEAHAPVAPAFAFAPPLSGGLAVVNDLRGRRITGGRPHGT